MRRHTSKNRKTEVACLLESKRKKENAVAILLLFTLTEELHKWPKRSTIFFYGPSVQ
jgi:hypothetical protein